MSNVDYNDLVLAVSQVSINDPKKIHHAAIRQGYWWALTSRGKPFTKMIDGGESIRFTTRLRNKGSFRTYGDNVPLSAAKTQTLTNGSVPWCQAYAEKSWADKEIVLNGGGSAYSEDYRMMKFIDLYTNLENGLQVDIAEGMEDKWLATPDKNTMEGLGATEPMPVGAWINDHHASSGATNGNFYNTTTGQWTSQASIANTDAGKTRWRNRVGGYNTSAAKPASGALNVVNAFDDMYWQLNYRPPQSGMGPITGANLWESDQWPNMVCTTSRAGMRVFQDLIRQQGDRWTQAANPDPAVGGPRGGPVYGDVEMFYAPGLDTALLYLDSYASPGVMVTEMSGSGAGVGPRYYFNNLTSIGIKIHQDRHFKRTGARQYDLQPFDNTEWVDVYFNSVCDARWLNAIISPGTVTGQFPAQVYAPASIYS